MDELLTTKELAAKLRRHVTYIYAMKRQGFRMTARLATLREAQEWLTIHGQPRQRLSKRRVDASV